MSKKDLKCKKYYVDGMHCASCEILVEKNLLKDKNVVSVDASLKDDTVSIYYKKGKLPNISAINKRIKKDGYFIDDEEIMHKDEETTFEKAMYIFTLTFAILFVFFVVEKLNLGRYVSVDGKSAVIAFLILGLVAGTSSCAALIGGLLLSLNKRWTLNKKKSGATHNSQILFHLGRVFSFFAFGGLLGAVGAAFTFNNVTITSILVIFASLIMLFLALQMLGVKQTKKLRFSIPKSVFNKIFSRASGDSFSSKEPLLIGAATFFLPCGFTLMAQTAALTTGSFLRGAIVMTAFAVGTIPTLAAIGVSGEKATKHRDGNLIKVIGLTVIFFALYSINSQLNVLGLPSANDIKLSGTRTAQVEIAPNQTINVVASGFDYIPQSSTTLKSGPGKIVIDNQGIQGCGAFVAARGLFDGYVALAKGKNVIEINASPGTYKLTCTMGMVKPVIITVI